jgi:hypothetical protein
MTRACAPAGEPPAVPDQDAAIRVPELVAAQAAGGWKPSSDVAHNS